MLKNTVTGSFLAKMFPTMAKHFLENASQEEVNKAEQEAAVIHQQLSAGTENSPESGTAELAALTTSAELTAMTTRATTAEQKVTDLQGKLTAAEADRDNYKAWYDKQTNKGTALPGADATTRGSSTEAANLSAASAAALATFRKSKA